MDEFRAWLLERADDVSRAMRVSGQSFGFLSDGRDHVALSREGQRLGVDFPDHADEGWPAFAVDVPADATFSAAFLTVLSRVASFRFPRRAVDVATDLEALGIDLRSTFDGQWCADVGGGAVLTLTRGSDRPALLQIVQRRTLDDIARVLRERADARASASGR